MARPRKPLADKLRQAIRESGLSQYDVARAIDVQPSTVSRFLRGQVNLQLDSIDRLMDFFDFKVSGPHAKRGRWTP